MDNYDIKCRIIEEELKTFWPQWHVVKHLGGGAFGDVFEIYRDNFGIRETSALKMIQIRDEAETQALFLSASGEASSRTQYGKVAIPDAFRNEIQIMEALRGAPNVVTIEDFYLKKDSSSTMLFVRMELLNSFQQMMAERQRSYLPFTISEVLKIGRDICTALMFCEKKGIIHRDIKPANLFIDGFGNYKVGDFGASKRMDTVHMAQTMTGIGTISYMAPEVFRGRSYNNTVDIYALGLIMYQLLNNCRIPFLPTEGAYTIKDIDSANYQRLHKISLPSLAGKMVGGERIDRRLDAIVLKACAMNPRDRYQTAKEFYDALAFLEKVEKKSTSEYIKEGQYSQALTISLEGEQQPKEQPERKKHSGEKKIWISILAVLFLVFFVAALFLFPKGVITVWLPDSITVDIPDPILKKAIQDELGIRNREITKIEAYFSTTLIVHGKENNEVKDITGLSAFKNLKNLSLADNQISDISELSGMTNLTSLDLGYNQVSDISALSGLTNLTYLYFSGNQISDISELSGLTNLEVLNLRNNQISDINALSNLTNLKILHMSGNPVLENKSREEIKEVLSGAENLQYTDMNLPVLYR